MADRSRVDFGTVRGTQFLQPLFEFSGACAGCGETPYLKLLSQLFGDRAVIANATGCSSIYGGNLPTTPWTTDAEGRGPAWSNSLFEDNAEFGLGLRLAADRHVELARTAPRRTAGRARRRTGRRHPRRTAADRVGASSTSESVWPSSSAGSAAWTGPRLGDLASVVDHLVRRSVWIVGGDGWAYDIGFGGLDHVLASGRNVNVLVLDTEVYSNTGGQTSKATPLGAVAKFAAAGKTVEKKDLALQAIAYGSVYVARVAMGADPEQTLRAFREAEAYDGPSLRDRLQPLHRPRHRDADRARPAVPGGGERVLAPHPLRPGACAPRAATRSCSTRPDPASRSTTTPRRELRYSTLANSDPAEAERLGGLAQAAVSAALGDLRGDGDAARSSLPGRRPEGAR